MTRRRGRPLTGVLARVDEALWNAAEESRDHRGVAADLDWPAETQLARFIEQGAHGAGQSGAAPPSMSDMALAVTMAVDAVTNPKRRRALRLYYWRYRGNESLCAYSFNSGLRWFRVNLRGGRMEVAAILGLPN